MSITVFYENAGCRLVLSGLFFIVFKPKNKKKLQQANMTANESMQRLKTG